MPQTDIEPGAKDEAVKQLQDCLVVVGYMTQEQVNTGHGKLGPMTEAAVKSFQSAWNLPATGRYEADTRAALEKTMCGEKPPVGMDPKSCARSFLPPSRRRGVLPDVPGRCQVTSTHHNIRSPSWKTWKLREVLRSGRM